MIAGEDHDFDEVNHTFVYNENHGSLHKVKYHTMEMPETTVSRYYPDKAELKQTLKTMFILMKETVHTQGLLRFVTELLTNMTRGLICLKQYCMKHLKHMAFYL